MHIDYYQKKWTTFLKSLGAVFDHDTEKWVIQDKHINKVKLKLNSLDFSFKEVEIIEEKKDWLDISDTFNSMLLEPRSYQKKAANLMVNSPTFGLFDDCGLGKTVSSLASVNGLMKKKGYNRILVLAEIKALDQWISEIDRFLGIKAVKVRGTKGERVGLWKEARRKGFAVTNYHLLLKDSSYFRKSWDIIIFDEASRYLRNRNAKLTSKARQLNSKYKWVLTASPIENNLVDVFSLYELMDRNILGNWETFKERHIRTKDIIVGRYRTSSGYKNKTVEKIVGYRKQEEVKKKISEYFVRRTTDDVGKELPDLIEQDIFIPLNKEQREEYERLNREIQDKAYVGDVKVSQMGEMIRLRRLCDDLCLLDGFEESCSSKFDEIMDFIYENKHRKMIIFSQWTAPLRLLADRLDKEKYKYSTIVGSASKSKFDISSDTEELNNFKNEDYNILLSSDAGSRSLNLQVAPIVINMDLPWNPQTIKQRIGRARRIGSKHSVVTVYNLVSKDTVEESVLPVLKKKLKLSENMIDKNVYNANTISSIEDFIDNLYRRDGNEEDRS